MENYVYTLAKVATYWHSQQLGNTAVWSKWSKIRNHIILNYLVFKVKYIFELAIFTNWALSVSKGKGKIFILGYIKGTNPWRKVNTYCELVQMQRFLSDSKNDPQFPNEVVCSPSYFYVKNLQEDIWPIFYDPKLPRFQFNFCKLEFPYEESKCLK